MIIGILTPVVAFNSKCVVICRLRPLGNYFGLVLFAGHIFRSWHQENYEEKLEEKAYFDSSG